jgi:hypothetical protein
MNISDEELGLLLSVRTQDLLSTPWQADAIEALRKIREVIEEMELRLNTEDQPNVN